MSQDFKRVRPFDDFPPLEVAAGDTRTPTFVPDGSITDAQIAGGISPTKLRLIGTKVYNSATQAIGDSANTVLTFDTENFDTMAGWTSGASSKITVAQTGIYVITANVCWDTTSFANSRYIVRLPINGSLFEGDSRRGFTTAQSVRHTLSSVRKLTNGDYLEVNVNQNTGGNLNVLAGEADCSFDAVFMGTI